VALFFGLIVGTLRTLPSHPWLVRLGNAWVELFRNIPLLVQIFLWYFVVPKMVPAFQQVPGFVLVVFALGFSQIVPQSLAYVTLKRRPSASTSSPSVGRSLSRAPEYVQPPWALVKTPRPWKAPSLKSPSYLPTHDDISMHRCQRGRQGHGARRKAHESKHYHDRLPHCPVEICHAQAC
jgi:His/Glu/Gln/Arg/opine family amino acid ABC transporter permease subunit